MEEGRLRKQERKRGRKRNWRMRIDRKQRRQRVGQEAVHLEGKVTFVRLILTGRRLRKEQEGRFHLQGRNGQGRKPL